MITGVLGTEAARAEHTKKEVYLLFLARKQQQYNKTQRVDILELSHG